MPQYGELGHSTLSAFEGPLSLMTKMYSYKRLLGGRGILRKPGVFSGREREFMRGNLQFKMVWDNLR